ncbi:MAG: hypothetical protein AseanaTS_19260 [Candidatus Pelagadaptatus aseana]|uniref:hypothetical protein n=1 Tax=Candidatus Pelagadaptatus aseana TaxID=3120508 RepID=UPI0039B22A68
MANKKTNKPNTSRKRKRDNPIFVICMMIAAVISAVVVTVTVVSDQQAKPATSGHSELSRVTDPEYAFTQAETQCLASARRSFEHPNALYIDGRSTQDLGEGQFRVFLRVDPSVSMGSESILVCEAGIDDGYMRVTGMKEQKPGEAQNIGIKKLLEAFKTN